jgi:hypothetical protein
MTMTLTARSDRPNRGQAVAVISASQRLTVVRPGLFLLSLRNRLAGVPTLWVIDTVSSAMLVIVGGWLGWRLFHRRAAVVSRTRNFCWFMIFWSVVEWYGLGMYSGINSNGAPPFTGQAAVNGICALLVLATLSVVRTPPSEAPPANLL